MKYYIILFSVFFSLNTIIGQNKREQKIIDAYLQVSNQKMGDKYMPLIKWNRDSIGYFIYGKMKGMTQKKWERFLSKIEKLSGLHFFKTENNKEAQILIYFGKITDYFQYEGINYNFQIPNDWVNWSQRVYDFSFGLKKSSFCVDKDEIHDFNYMRYLLKHNFLKALGIFGSMRKKTCVLSKEYSKKYGNSSLKKIDKTCVALHYSDVIKSGMKKKEVEYALSADNIVNSILESIK